jgi:ATP-dependent Clp protease adaptor protein ClpS
MVPFDRRSEKENTWNQSIQDRLLILHNDEINTFDHVIEVLQEVCNHDKIQAEQCALITHLKGWCEIKRGTLNELEDIQGELSGKYLTVTID